MKPGHLHERASASAGPSVTASTIAVGTCLVLILYGQAMQEAYHYYRRYPKDGYLLKGIITALVFCDTVHTIMIAYTCYAILVTASSMPSDGITNFVITSWSFLLVGPTAVITLHLTHCFFARRLFKLGKQPAALRYIVAMMVLGGIGLEILYVVEEFKNGRPAATTPIFILVLLSLSFVLDVVLTSLLVLRLRKSRTGFKSTDNLINRLITFSLNTGLLNGLLTAASIILLAATPQHFAYFPVTAILSPGTSTRKR
ncbi:hypothetical protein C8Q74DRAFT_747807 [Fomes fomentarius]|nr:hypothetical protein C8Q74DRAFT_747807 [Fomes fomentarius]